MVQLVKKKILNPKGYYAVTKLKGEKIIKKFSKKYNYEYAILRYFNVAGASSSGKIGEINASHDHLIKNLAIQSNKKKPTIFVYGNDYKTKDGTCIRDYIHVDDLADIHIKALNYINKKKKAGTSNSKKKSTISAKAYKNMKSGFKK